MNNTSILFPPFLLKYSGKEINLLTKHNVDFQEKLRLISEISGVSVNDFDIASNNFLTDEFRNQLMSYLFCTLYADILYSRSHRPKHLSALSMGLYAAMYCARSIDFAEGVRIIKRVYSFLMKQTQGKAFCMLAITGFSHTEIIALLNKHALKCTIAIKNNKHSFIITGESRSITRLYDLAKHSGALHLNMFPVSIPYHSAYINTTGLDSELFQDISLKQPLVNIVSSINQDILSSPESLYSEVIRNLTHTADWNKTITSLISKGETSFIECGPGDSLRRISRFINEEHIVTGISKVI